MKLLTISLLFVITSIQCGDKFEITNATSQKWTGGREETGYGTYYELTIIPEVNSDQLIFDKLWIGEKFFEVQCYQKGKRIKNNTFDEGDYVTIRVNDAVVSEKFRDPDRKKVHEDLPKEYKSKALLSYTYKGKRKYKAIESFKELEKLNYQ